MAKDTYYFSHDYNARFDEKIKSLIRKHGMLGYGCFWAIVEDLYNNTNVLRTDFDSIAFDLRITKEQAESIITEFDLFTFEGDYFRSESVSRRLSERNEKSNKARESVLKRWNKHKNDTNVLQSHNDSNTIKERKGKEIKEKEIKVESNTRDLSIYGNFETVSKNITEDEIFLTEAAHLLNTSIETVKEFSEKKLLEMKATGAISRYSVSAIRGFILKDFKQQKEKEPKLKDNSAGAMLAQLQRIRRKNGQL